MPDFAHIRQQVDRDGYSLISEWRPGTSTIEIAGQVGAIIDIGTLIPDSKVPTVQSLIPRTVDDAPRNQYSSVYGVTDFPLHTDLAHWAEPPRYFLLRCVAGSDDVRTRLLPVSSVLNSDAVGDLERAWVRPRRATASSTCLLPIRFRLNHTPGFRWDPLFVIPATTGARRLAAVMNSTRHWPALSSVALAQPGDTLIIDNWTCLHGRSAVPTSGLHRHIERVYLSELN